MLRRENKTPLKYLTGTEVDKFSIQDSQYVFPYHYIPSLAPTGSVSISRRLNWGLEYLCYQRHLREKIVKYKPYSLLEVGCGDGRFLGDLPSTLEIKVGVDLSDRAIAFAQAFHPKIDFRVQDASTMSETFDMVVAIEVIEHIPDDRIPEFLNTLSRRAGDKGRVIISAPTTVVPLNKKHYRHYTLELLEEQLANSESGLRIVSYEYIFAKPFWYDIFVRFLENRIFSLEVKALTRWAWRRVWEKYRYANSGSGFHLIAVLEKEA